jgi:co-chaperonin GroES (HSP10)
MQDLELITNLQRQLRQLYQNVGDSMISGGVDNMEKYKYMLGQAHAYQYISQEISNLLNKKEQKDQTTESHVKRLDQDNIQSMLDQLPNPSGYRMLVLPFTPKEKTKGGIIFSQESLDKARIATNCGYVLKLGPLCYHDKDKFPTGPWCKEKDWVIFARYAGSRLPIEGGEVRLLNDDEVLGTVKDPESVLHYI